MRPLWWVLSRERAWWSIVGARQTKRLRRSSADGSQSFVRPMIRQTWFLASTSLSMGSIRAAHARRHVLLPPRDLTVRPYWDLRFTKQLHTPEGHLRDGPFMVSVRGRSKAVLFRIEVVQDERPLWLCLRVTDSARLSLLSGTAETLSVGWRSPLRFASETAALPVPLMWRCANAEQLLQRIVQICATDGIDQIESIDVGAPAQSAATGAQREDREVARLISRRGAIPRGRRYPISGSCDHCGQPLSDPFSLLIGIGPVCRGYYSPRVIQRVAADLHVERLDPSTSRDPEDAIARLRAAWR